MKTSASSGTSIKASPQNLTAPDAGGVWWTFQHTETLPDGSLTTSYTHVYAMLWIDALAMAQSELGTPDPYLYPEDYDERKRGL